MLAGTTLYWTGELREAVEQERHIFERAQIIHMQEQLDRIEKSQREFTSSILALQMLHNKPTAR
jgi:hypothetical protein